MNKIRLSTGLASIMIAASIFAGWQTLLLVILFMFLFCDVQSKVKEVAVRVITFYVGYYIVYLGWDVIVNSVSLLTKGINSFVATFNTYANSADYLVASKITTPINFVIDMADGIVSIMFTLVKIGFVISILTGKSKGSNALGKKIDIYVNKALHYVDSFVDNVPVSNMQTNYQQPVQQMPNNQAMNQNIRTDYNINNQSLR